MKWIKSVWHWWHDVPEDGTTALEIIKRAHQIEARAEGITMLNIMLILFNVLFFLIEIKLR